MVRVGSIVPKGTKINRKLKQEVSDFEVFIKGLIAHQCMTGALMMTSRTMQTWRKMSAWMVE